MIPDAKNVLINSCICCLAAAVNPNGIKTILANGLIKFFIKGNPVFSNGPKILPKLFILADESFVKALRIFETCVVVNNNLC